MWDGAFLGQWVGTTGVRLAMRLFLIWIALQLLHLELYGNQHVFGLVISVGQQLIFSALVCGCSVGAQQLIQ